VYDIILKAAESGQCVCWIRNTVTDARESFEHFKTMNAQKISLFHARFTLSDRLKIEESVKDNFGKDSGYQNRHGKILIATQVVEQSLDLDFDLLISDLAPIDLIIQRAGRLHRHVRDYRQYDPVLYVLSPEPAPDPAENWFGSFFPKAKKIYPHVGQLWLTARLLSEKGCIRTPDGARTLIEGVYGNDAEMIPEKMLESSWTAEGEQKGKKSMGTRNALEVDKGYSRQDALWDEDANFPTRLGEDTVTVYLTDEQLNPLFDGKHSWGLSSVKIYKSHLSDISSNVPKSLKTKLNHLRETEKRLQYGSVVLPMTRLSENRWRADGIDGKGQEVKVIYDSELGLFTERGK
jgi:CRISPR-associated endonuclease/helicase Cas3